MKGRRQEEPEDKGLKVDSHSFEFDAQKRSLVNCFLCIISICYILMKYFKKKTTEKSLLEQ